MRTKRPQVGSIRRRLAPVGALVAAAIALVPCTAARAGANESQRWFGRTHPVDARVFRFANGAEPEVLDPALMSGQPDGRIAKAIFEGLAATDPKTLDPVPGMATRWDLSADGLSYTFHLRRGVRWTNGDPITARDFEWSWLRVLHPDTPARYADNFYMIENARAYKKKEHADPSRVGVHAVDDSTLVVQLESPTAYFMQLVTFYPFMPVHRATVERHGDRWTHPENIVTNGAFRLAMHKPNDRIVLEKNPTYWDAANVRLDRVVAYASDDLSTMLNMYRAGMTDWNPSGYLPAQYIPYVRHYGDYRSGPYLGTYFYSFNVTRPPFDDARVRRAFAFAIDREQIVKYLLHDSKTPWGGIVPPGFETYPYPEGVRFDADRARALLAAAGYPGARGFPKVEILFNTSLDHRKIAEAIQEMWKRELGVEVGLSNQEFGSYMKACVGLQYQVARRSWIGDYKDPNTFLYMLRGGDGNNRTGWTNAGFDSLVAAAGRELDPARRMQILARAETVALEAMPFLPIYGYRTVELVAPYVRGWYPTALDSHPLKHIWIESGEPSAQATGAAGTGTGSSTAAPPGGGR